jgi:hypothetical protein
MNVHEKTNKTILRAAVIGALAAILSALITVTVPAVRPAIRAALGALWKAEPYKGIPSVVITVVPPYDPVGGPSTYGAEIAGEVSASEPQKYRIVIYARTDSTWYVQPYDYSPITSIGSDGRWRTRIHLGADYAALVVKSAFHADRTLEVLPNVGGDVVAEIQMPGRK